METAGDMIRVLIEDERAIRLKNEDLAALRAYRDGLLEDAQR